jgi:AraC-like DNA-binding protein
MVKGTISFETTGKDSDERLNDLPFPLRCLISVRWVQPDEAFKSGFFGKRVHQNQSALQRSCSEVADIEIGQVKAIAIRTMPVVTREEGDHYSTLLMMFDGDLCRYCDELHSEDVKPGDIHLNPRNGCRSVIGYFSGIICEIDHQTLRRTMSAMRGDGFEWNSGKSYLIQGHGSRDALDKTGHLWSLISLVDQLLAECPYLSSGLGLDDQLYRRLALSILRAEGLVDKIDQRWRGTAQKWSSQLDELIDFIRANTHRNLSITDLEEQSCYSARHLQNLFRERFDCTPMQYVRRQRLNSAMEQLQTADWNTTVIQAARDCGYVHLSTFSYDFKREFGVTPSAVLKATRLQQT